MGMDKKETAEAIKVMQAYIDGEKIDHKRRSDSKWFPLENLRPLWNWRIQEYRLTPIPREFWINKHSWVATSVEDFTPEDMTHTIKVQEILDE